VSVRALGADFYALSFHKMMGPGGIGALYGRADLLDRLEPLLLGGNTVDDATYEAPTLAPVPARLEAGVPAADLLAGVRAAIGWVGALDPAAVRAHLLDLNRAATGALLALPRVSLIGPPDPAARGGIVNFHVRGVPSRDLALLLDDREAVMVRHGKQCVHSWYRAEGVPDSVRASFAVYNTLEEVERLVRVVRSVASMIG
jgi:cysteine desulfurase/selenocysteine lyase